MDAVVDIVREVVGNTLRREPLRGLAQSGQDSYMVALALSVPRRCKVRFKLTHCQPHVTYITMELELHLHLLEYNGTIEQ